MLPLSEMCLQRSRRAESQLKYKPAGSTPRDPTTSPLGFVWSLGRPHGDPSSC